MLEVKVETIPPTPLTSNNTLAPTGCRLYAQPEGTR